MDMIDQYRAVLRHMISNTPYKRELEQNGWEAGTLTASVAIETKGPGVGSHLVRRELANPGPSRTWRQQTGEYSAARRAALQTAIRRFEAIEN